MEKIVDRRVGKKTRRKTYFEYLVKWKGRPVEDACWVGEEDIQKHGRLCTRAHGQDSMNFSAKGVFCRSIASKAQAGDIWVH
jgi:hypothetical protein